ncbi:MAG TPA: hypothetical protein VE219_04380 [Candidatus Sulfotelmatobacter sp.]|nr:hypothetical protein [Candidatus Sulfotelmatobacter sp.]
MELKIVNPDPAYATVKLVEPAPRGYIHVAVEVRPRRLPFLQRLPAGREKSALISRLTELARQLEALEAVEKVTVFDALAITPARSAYLKERGESIHVPRFDVVVLIETTSPAVIRDVQSTPLYEALLATLRSQAKRLHVMAARNAKRVGDVDKTRQGLFLFNYFVADDAPVMLQLWDYLAGWYAVETGLDNSTLLVPLEGERSDYLAINNARWDESLPRFLWRQFSKKSFRTYVLANLEANRVGAMPVLYRLAGSSQQAARPLRPWVLAASVVAFGAGLTLARRRRAYAREFSVQRRP